MPTSDDLRKGFIIYPVHEINSLDHKQIILEDRLKLKLDTIIHIVAALDEKTSTAELMVVFASTGDSDDIEEIAMDRVYNPTKIPINIGVSLPFLIQSPASLHERLEFAIASYIVATCTIELKLDEVNEKLIVTITTDDLAGIFEGTIPFTQSPEGFNFGTSDQFIEVA